jgi:hypothetical protein
MTFNSIVKLYVVIYVLNRHLIREAQATLEIQTKLHLNYMAKRKYLVASIYAE